MSVTRPTLIAFLAGAAAVDVVSLDDEELLSLYRDALAVLYPPFDEDFGYVTLEAFLSRKPVITATDSGGPNEFVVDGDFGCTWPPIRIEEVFHNPVRCSQITRACGGHRIRGLGETRRHWGETHRHHAGRHHRGSRRCLRAGHHTSAPRWLRYLREPRTQRCMLLPVIALETFSQRTFLTPEENICPLTVGSSVVGQQRHRRVRATNTTHARAGIRRPDRRTHEPSPQ